MQIVKNFWIRRWFRTLPNYFLFLLLNITVFQWVFHPTTYDINYFFFLQNLAWPSLPLMQESWSLAVEEWFYITFPILLFVLMYFTSNKKKTILTGLTLYILLFTVIRFVFVGADMEWGPEVRRVVIYRLDAIGYGVLFAYLNFYHNEFLKKNASKFFILGCILTLLALFLHSYGVLTTRETFFHKTVLFIFIDMGLALLLPFFMKIKTQHKFVLYTVEHISIVSYSIYLIHFSFTLPLLGNYFPIEKMPWQLTYMLYLVITLMLSTLVYKFYEQPMTSLREKFSN